MLSLYTGIYFHAGGRIQSGCSARQAAEIRKLRKYAEYEDMVVAGEYSDEGFSGKNIQGRHELQLMQDFGVNLICVEDS